VAYHLRTAHPAKRAQRGHKINRFEDVCLALCVTPQQQMESGEKILVQPRVVAEVTESQMSQMHPQKIGAGPDFVEFNAVLQGKRPQIAASFAFPP
jgi:hypothetical protein